MSYIEFFGTIFSIVCVWLTARAKVWNWPVGIVGTFLFLMLFYQIHLYSDMVEQAYFLVTGFVGWYAWTRIKKPSQLDSTNSQEQKLTISYSSVKELIKYGVIILGGTFLLTYCVSNFDNWLPQYFPAEATFAFIDSFTTVMSFMAQYLLIRKKIESWIIWIIVDVIGIWLYWVKGVRFISLEYVLFLFIASYGLWGWIKEYRVTNTKTNAHEPIATQI